MTSFQMTEKIPRNIGMLRENHIQERKDKFYLVNISVLAIDTRNMVKTVKVAYG